MTTGPASVSTADPVAAVGRTLTALLTPCDADTGRVDVDAIPALVDHQVAQGIEGLFVLGTAGQGPLQSLEERKRTLAAILAAASGRLKVVAHVGASRTSDTLDLLEDALAAGADAVSSVPPTYYQPDAATVDQYFDVLLRHAAGRPLLAYDNPAAVGIGLSREQITEYVKRGMAGAKVARKEIIFIQELAASGVPTWTANADLNLSGFAVGAVGSISTITNVTPALFVALRDAVVAGDTRQAHELQARASRAAAALRTPIIGALHYAAGRLGLPAGAPRQPLRLPDATERARIDAVLVEEKLV